MGTMSTQLVREFFYAISYSAMMNLHLKVLTPGNDHHMAEAMFKAFGKALDEATRIDPRITDVLSTKEVVTNWDQGKVTLAELKAILDYILAHERVIGMDVCGEYDLCHSLFEDEQAADLDSHANESILKEAVS